MMFYLDILLVEMLVGQGEVLELLAFVLELFVELGHLCLFCFL